MTAILLPIAINSAPDENVMKFKKGNNTLGTVIRELVNSDKYYANGDLGMKPDGTLIDGTHDGDNTYFCETFADVVSTKSVNCSGDKSGYQNDENNRTAYVDVREDDPESKADEACKNRAATTGEEIITSDGIVYYQAVPCANLYGMTWNQVDSSNGLLPTYCEDNYQNMPDMINQCRGRFYNSGIHIDSNGFEALYRTFCMDIDGIDKGEDPFGYGIRADGKIFLGARAQEWLKKSIQKGE